MQVFRSSIEAQTQFSSTSVAIGNFDGVHLGHQALFRRAVELAAKNDLSALALTFTPHPERFFNAELAPLLIQTEAQRLRSFEQSELAAAVIEPFDRALAMLTPVEFIETILVDRLHARHIVVGETFVFGRKRAGNIETLRQHEARWGYTTHAIAPVFVKDIVVSSSKIREFLLMGRVDAAAMLLGRDFELEGTVVDGAGRGRTIGIPTANLEPDGELWPGQGVYGGVATLSDGRRFPTVINIGIAPTFQRNPQHPLKIEAHLLEYQDQGSLRGSRLTLGFKHRIRDERRFSSGEELVRQIHTDIAYARSRMEE